MKMIVIYCAAYSLNCIFHTNILPQAQHLILLNLKNVNNEENKNTPRNWIKSFPLSAECHLIVIPNRYIDSSKSAQKNTSCAGSFLCPSAHSNWGDVEERMSWKWDPRGPMASLSVECTERAQLFVCPISCQLLQTYLLQKKHHF